MHSLTNLNMLSPDGQCYSFDHRGNGYSRGEGFAVLVLKRVSDAIRDNDTIRGIIRSTGCNQDGFTPSITLPNPDSQEALIRQTYRKAGLSMVPTRFFEAHGTGTSVGDPNEAKALGSSFRQVRTTQDPLWVGALKSNIGHLEGASGISGVIKAALVLEKAIIPPNTNFEKVNPKIDTEFLRIQFPVEPTPWPSKGLRRASVNSFGNAGTNAHVVLDDVRHFLEEHGLVANHLTVRDPPEQAVFEPTVVRLPLIGETSMSQNVKDKLERPKLLVLSANDEHGVQRHAKEFASHFSDLSTPLDSNYLDNLAYTLSFRRSSLLWKSFAVVKSVDALSRLDKLLSPAKKSVSSPDMAFIFTGQGAQWAGMGHELLSIDRFKHSLQTSEKFLLQLGSSWRLCEEILRTDNSRINTPELAQPICTALQIALLNLLDDFNVHPVAVIGHSSGEIAAAYSTGAISAESALSLAYYRGTLSGSLASQSDIEGTMMSVGLSETEVLLYIATIAKLFGRCNLTVACINSLKSVTISGDNDQINALKDLLDKEQIFARKLRVGIAYHSPYMLPAAEHYRSAIQGIKPGIAPRRPVAMISSVTGERVSVKDLLSADYWVSNMVSPVRFLKAMDILLSKSGQRGSKKLDLSHRNHFHIDMLVEVGPHSALQAPIHETLLSFRTTKNINYASVLLRDNSAIDSAFNALGEMLCLGHRLNMERVNNLRSNCRKYYQALPDIPGYVFDHSQRYWDESRISAQYRTGGQGKLDLLGKPVPDWNPMEARWRNHLRVSEMPWIEDHVINGALIYPGAGILVMAIEAANQVTKATDGVVGFEIKNVSFLKPLNILRDPAGIETQLVLHMAQDLPRPLGIWSEFRVFAYEQGTWRECCHGHVRAKYMQNPNEVENKMESREELDECREIDSSYSQTCTIPFEPSKFYAAMKANGLESESTFHRVVGGFYDNEMRVTGSIEPFIWPKEEYPQPHVIHPTTLDAVFQLALAGLAKGGEEATPTMIPTFLRNLYVHKTGLSFAESKEIHECAWLSINNSLFSEFGGFALTHSKDTLLVQFDDLRLTKIATTSEENASHEGFEAHQLSYHIEYKLDLTLLDPKSIDKYCRATPGLMQTEFNRYIDLIAHKDSDLNILEIDVEAREMTQDMLKTLSVYGSNGDIVQTRYSSFRFLTSSQSSLAQAEKDLGGYPAIELGLLGPQNDMGDQGLAHGSYDILLASKTAQDLEVLLKMAHTLLKNNGILVLHENTNPIKISQLSDGVFVNILEKNGFPSCELQLTCGPQSVVHIHRIEQGTPTSSVDKSVFVILDSDSPIQTQVSDAILNILSRRGVNLVSTISLEDAINIPQPHSAFFMVLLELDQDLLYSVREKSFNVLQKFFVSAHDVLWMTFAGGSTAGKPEYAMIHGLARALRNEYRDLNLTVMALDAEKELSTWQMETVARVAFRNHIENSAGGITDVELLEIDKAIYIPRVVPSIHVTTELHKRSETQHSGVTLMRDAPPLTLTIGSPGLLDTLHFVEDEIFPSPLLADEVEIHTRAIGVNFKDCLIALGQLVNAALGQECAGVVTRAGPETGFKPGDRVVLAASETFRTFARGKAWGAFRIPEHLPFTVAAAIPAQFGTAWHVIHRLARLQRGESILIHSAAGGTGQAAIQIAQAIGATVFATVGYQRKKQLLMDTYQIPEHHIFYSRSTGFSKSIRRITNGRGVDVVVNSLVGDRLLASWECVAPNGRFIEIGKKDILSDSSLPMFGFRQNVAFFGFDGSLWLQDKPDSARQDLEHMIDLFANNTLHTPQPLHIYDISETEKVFRLTQDGEISGKIVLQVTHESQVPTILRTKPSFQLHSNATFVIAGGLGGIGRATARWMVDRGARNLILLSRFGPRTSAARELIEELQSHGVRVETPACDITDFERTKEVFRQLSADMPPIKGMLQMSVITQDFLFKDLDYYRWKSAVDCKTVGSWNLHSILPQGMDFFILLGSASGLAGIRGQTNYDAGNTYEDALARFRVALGEKATSLDLGAMVDDGILAENPDLLNRVLTYGTLERITRRKFYSILDYYCNPNLPVLTPAESQVAIGLGTGGGQGLDSIDFSRQPMLQPLMLAGERKAAAVFGAKNIGMNATFKEEFAASASLDKAAEVVSQAIVQKLAKSLVVMQDASSVDYHKPLQMYGVDSLLAIELRNWIVKEMKADIAVFETQGASTLSTLSMLVAGRSAIKHHDWTAAGEKITK
ncbi:putative polyketide synthase [Talaromyces proteolyticus]|uniref:Polyketide synthase n=1 Tax=Talaromyces proteolyticus TaxID=1131652 RepID=A0AAD4KP59_9EURO|nr:putative polyketide synthase [Talaromyces proteolyticus]KAH8695168.1 putative polyketide synthase [Talaromyces proteolyticus]